MQLTNKIREAGFTAKEADSIRRIAAHSGFGDPDSVFSCKERLDRFIRLLVHETRTVGKGDDRETSCILSKFYDCRQKAEIDGHVNKIAISNTHQIKNGQILKIFVSGSGVFRSQVVKNATGYMTISRPLNAKNVSLKEWRGTMISVYFWKEGDAGYMFDTEVKDEVFSLGILSLKIAHRFSLSRVQKRRSVRTKMNVPAFLYLVGEGEPFHKIESSPGLRCMLEDISDTGCAVTVGGKASDDLHVKMQFELNGAAVCISGTVRSTIFREDTNRSVLHIEADPMPTEMRNRILGKVFGTFEEEDYDDRPFRALDEEALGASYQNLVSDHAHVDSLTESGGEPDDGFDLDLDLEPQTVGR